MILKNIALFLLASISLVWIFPSTLPAQQLPSEAQIMRHPQALEAIRSGKTTPQEISSALERAKQGTLTTQEIAEGKKLLEQSKELESKQAEEKQETEEEVVEEEPEEDLESQKSVEKPKSIIFGHNLFTRSPGTFDPIRSIPVSNNYVIGPGDEIKVMTWGRLDASYELEVDTEGNINFPKLGPLTVAGLTFGEVKQLIRRRIEAITGVNVNISMGRLRTIQVFVLGEVKNPGVYTVSSLATIANALMYSGGPTNLGTLRRIQLKRRGRVTKTIDLYNFLLKGDTSNDTRLMPGDVVFVPQAGAMVSVSGNVKRPAIYELHTNNTLNNIIQLSGGLKPDAYNQRIQIQRAFQNQYTMVLDIPFGELAKRKETALQDGDVVKVFSVLPGLVNAVFLIGNVQRPGSYAYKPGLRLTDIVGDINDLGIDTYYDYALIKRYHMETMKPELIPFDLGGLLLKKDRSQNIVLKPNDEIHIFNLNRFEDKPVVKIEGEVRKPASYAINLDGFHVSDLVFRAGQLTRDAYLKQAHMYRFDKDTKKSRLLTFNLQAAMNNDPEHNLLLQDRDRIIVHSIWEYQQRYTVTVQGLVNNPGDHTFASGMTIRDLILVGGNIKDAAYLDEAELVRYDIIDGKQVETSVVNFNLRLAIQNDPAHNLKLKPLDVVTIKEIPAWWDKKKTVVVQGEVLFPGTYQIREEERLSTILERAGGYTENAYLRGAVFKRESARVIQQQRINEMTQRLEIELARAGAQEAQAAISEESVTAQVSALSAMQALISRLKQTKATGRIISNFLPLNIFKGSKYDVILQDGDLIDIPPKPMTVNVLGSVYNPTALIWDEQNPQLGYYLAQVGGPTEGAEKDEMYVIRANGTVISKQGKSWVGATWDRNNKRWGFFNKFEKTKLFPGDTLLVPEKIIRPNWLRNTKDVTQILYQIALTAGVFYGIAF